MRVQGCMVQVGRRPRKEETRVDRIRYILGEVHNGRLIGINRLFRGL